MHRPASASSILSAWLMRLHCVLWSLWQCDISITLPLDVISRSRKHWVISFPSYMYSLHVISRSCKYCVISSSPYMYTCISDTNRSPLLAEIYCDQIMDSWWHHIKWWDKTTHPRPEFNGALITRFVGPRWGPSGAARTQVGPMLAIWTLLAIWVVKRNRDSSQDMD